MRASLNSVTAIILAGSRPGVDSFAAAHGVTLKSLIPVAGKAMLAHVVAAVSANRAINGTQIIAQDIKQLASDPDVADALLAAKAHLIPGAATIAQSLEAVLADPDVRFPLMVTTADNVLLNDPMIAHFLAQSDGSDVAVAVVERDVLLQSYPSSKRTWIKLKGSQYSGANLFYFGSEKAAKLLALWAEIEQDRKKGWKIFTVFGPWLLILGVLRLFTIDQLAERIGRKLGLKAKAVPMPQAEACIDVDKAEDLEMVESILARRRSPG
ncbi:nucleotidyltransferase family protein [Parasphingorhabdus halotolerans]|uniref:NTP transferase domain-containing protein n=1 Tax=Parasphingorhabdus halotolerans TaxID=2725558 RepID=A0A6H2DN65_9SPHN|nr:nucleotidyltransferase family protein [Parasphingorhabdus halotolerans]QJB69577.1 NTP transferase domain-containing protein [Parasphingorhabdus halotolerans]